MDLQVNSHVVEAGFGMFSGMHWIIILVVALLIFGRRLPDIMRGIGSSVREFRKGQEDGPAADKAGAISPPTSPETSKK